MWGSGGQKRFFDGNQRLRFEKPYNGSCELVSGEIAEDFAMYLLKSEGIKSAVSLGVKLDKNGAAAGEDLLLRLCPESMKICL